jgi:hypothetical protein
MILGTLPITGTLHLIDSIGNVPNPDKSSTQTPKHDFDSSSANFVLGIPLCSLNEIHL